MTVRLNGKHCERGQVSGDAACEPPHLHYNELTRNPICTLTKNIPFWVRPRSQRPEVKSFPRVQSPLRKKSIKLTFLALIYIEKKPGTDMNVSLMYDLFDFFLRKKIERKSCYVEIQHTNSGCCTAEGICQCFETYSRLLLLHMSLQERWFDSFFCNCSRIPHQSSGFTFL